MRQQVTWEVRNCYVEITENSNVKELIVKNRKSLSAAALMGVVILGMNVGTAVDAAHADESDITETEAVELVEYGLELAHPVSLLDAIDVAATSGLKPLAYRFENQNLVGEFSPATGIAPEEYINDIKLDYGVEPAVVQVIVEAPTEVVEQHGARSVPSELGSEKPAITQDAITSDSTVGRLIAAGQDAEKSEARGSVGIMSSPTRWDPDIAQNFVTRNPNAVNNSFSGHYVWSDLATAPYVLQDHHGLEFEVNIHSDNPMITGSGRPSCTPSNYKDVPFAKNYGWTWSAYTGSPNPPGGTITNLGALGVYADYNDLSDECNRNSIAIGLAIPQDLPLPYGSYQYYFGWNIAAPRGIDLTNRVSAVVQSVSTHWCETNTWMPLTDCMGVWNSGYGVNRPVLAEWRNWSAPDLCWVSLNYGTTAPTSFGCPV